MSKEKDYKTIIHDFQLKLEASFTTENINNLMNSSINVIKTRSLSPKSSKKLDVEKSADNKNLEKVRPLHYRHDPTEEYELVKIYQTFHS